MLFKNINKSSGEIVKTLLVLAVIVLIALGIAYAVVSRTKPKPPIEPITPGEVKPVYEATIGNIRFLFLEATNKGNTLFGKNSRYADWQKDLKTTERFIELTVGAQNIGKENTEDKIWTIGDMVDSEGRNYIPSTEEVRNWLSEQDPCGEILKPSFEPTPCKKIYEVAKVATGLKVKVIVFKKSYSEDKDEAIIDVKLMP
ncbi:hypothetical protein KJ786_02610 [Patescibacteria group bacterium]|nr:hypothetical protein [Patescibacteria group bacterium]